MKLLEYCLSLLITALSPKHIDSCKRTTFRRSKLYSRYKNLRTSTNKWHKILPLIIKEQLNIAIRSVARDLCSRRGIKSTFSKKTLKQKGPAAS